MESNSENKTKRVDEMTYGELMDILMDPSANANDQAQITAYIFTHYVLGATANGEIKALNSGTKQKVALGTRATSVAMVKGADSASNIVNGTRINRQLTILEASSVFTSNGNLKSEVIKNSVPIISGSKLNDPGVIKALTSNGSSVNDWAKMTTQTFKSLSGDFQV